MVSYHNYDGEFILCIWCKHDALIVAVPMFAFRDLWEFCELATAVGTHRQLKILAPPEDSPQMVDFRIRKRRSPKWPLSGGATGHLFVLRPSDLDGVPRRTFRCVHTFDDALRF